MITIQQATPDMACVASELILSSGPNSLRAMFEVNDTRSAREFIRFAFAQHEGQFSHVHHIAATIDNELAGIASYWTSQVSAQCRDATIESLIAHFGADVVPQIIQRSVMLQSVIPPPEPDGLGVGHIAVMEKFRRRGVASALLDHLAKVARQRDKQQLELDVECNNKNAIELYRKLGFKEQSRNIPGNQAASVGFTAHYHMQRTIDA